MAVEDKVDPSPGIAPVGCDHARLAVHVASLAIVPSTVGDGKAEFTMLSGGMGVDAQCVIP